MIAALCIVCFLAGIIGGYAICITRTDRLLAKMNQDELRALAVRVRRRRNRA